MLQYSFFNISIYLQAAYLAKKYLQYLCIYLNWCESVVQ